MLLSLLHLRMLWAARTRIQLIISGLGLLLAISTATPAIYFAISISTPDDSWLRLLGLVILMCFWPLLLVLSVLAVALGFGQRNPGRADLCRGCGYNLTGNTSGICPECGADCSSQKMKKWSADCVD